MILRRVSLSLPLACPDPFSGSAASTNWDSGDRRHASEPGDSVPESASSHGHCHGSDGGPVLFTIATGCGGPG